MKKKMIIEGYIDDSYSISSWVLRLESVFKTRFETIDEGDTIRLKEIS